MVHEQVKLFNFVRYNTNSPMLKDNKKYLTNIIIGISVLVFDIICIYVKYFDKTLSCSQADHLMASVNPLLFVILFFIALYLLLHKPKKIEKNKKIDVSRRRFLTFTATLAHDESFHAINGKLGKGVASFTGKRNPKSKSPIFPAGGTKYDEYRSKCTSCMACIEACPSRILEPGIKLGQGVIPHISFANGWCQPECKTCNDVCPAKALEKITLEEKNNIQIGHAVWIRENCISGDGKECRACEKACKRGCIEMVQNGRKLYPIINTYNCTGCGACEYACPATPLKGIYVESFTEHRTIN